MGGGDRGARSPRPGPIASRRANGEQGQPARHGDATRDDGIRANGATHAQRPPASLPSRGQIHQGEGPRPAQIARTTHRQPASPIENRTQIKHSNPQVMAPPAGRGQQQLGALQRQGKIGARESGAASGGGDPGGENDLARPGRRGGRQRASPPHRATDTNAHISGPTEITRASGQPQGHATRRRGQKQASGRRTVTATHGAPGPHRAGTVRAQDHAPGEGRRDGQEARSGRRSGHGNPQVARPQAPPGRVGGIAPPHVDNYNTWLYYNKGVRQNKRCKTAGWGRRGPKTGTTERQAAQEAPRAPPRPPQAAPMLMRALLPRRGRGGRSKSWVAKHKTCLARIPNPLYSHADASPCLFGTPWTGSEWSRKRKKTQNPTQISVLFLWRRNGDPGHGVLFGQGEVPAWEWGAHELSSQARDGAPSCRTPRPTRRHDAGPAGKGQGGGLFGRDPGPEGWPGTLATPRYK